MEETKAVVRVHNAKEMPDSLFWAGHGLTGALVILAVALIIVAKGPRRHEALQKMLNEPKKD